MQQKYLKTLHTVALTATDDEKLKFFFLISLEEKRKHKKKIKSSLGHFVS